MTPAQTFNGNASANELGLHTRVSGCIKVQGDEPFPQHYVDLIRQEIDPDFVPLWAETVWRTPNGGIVKTGCHVLARHVPHPRAGASTAKVQLPAEPVYGIKYQHPIVVAVILDGLTEDERDRGDLPRYEPITRQVVESMRRAMWLRNNGSLEDRIRAFEEADALEEAAESKRVAQEIAYRQRHDSLRLRKVMGKADSVFVSESLVKLREAAGMEDPCL